MRSGRNIYELSPPSWNIPIAGTIGFQISRMSKVRRLRRPSGQVSGFLRLSVAFPRFGFRGCASVRFWGKILDFGR